MRITKAFTFESSHVLPHHTGKCARLHGHSYALHVTITGPVKTEGAATGMVMDFEDISSAVKRRVIELLDHHNLNDVIENPTCERIVSWIWNALIPALPQLECVTLWETRTSSATLRRGDELTEAAP